MVNETASQVANTENIAPLYQQYVNLIEQLRDIDQFAFFSIQNTWDLRETTFMRRIAEWHTGEAHHREPTASDVARAVGIVRQRIVQLERRISSLVTPRRLQFEGLGMSLAVASRSRGSPSRRGVGLSKKAKRAVIGTATAAALAGLSAAAAHSYNKPPPPLRPPASRFASDDTPEVRESMARAERNAAQFQQLHDAQQKAWERSLYPNNRFYDAETW
jgi:hypothetical protein